MGSVRDYSLLQVLGSFRWVPLETIHYVRLVLDSFRWVPLDTIHYGWFWIVTGGFGNYS